MQIHEKTIVVQKQHLDELNHVNNVEYVQWVQDIAEEHWHQNATPNVLQAYFWVLITHHIEYKNEACLGDKLRLKTFIIKNEGVKSVRRVEIINENSGKQIFISDTTWCLMNIKTKRPSKITDEIVSLFK